MSTGHCEHKFKRSVDQIYTCKNCGKVVYKAKNKVLVKTKEQPQP